MANGHKGEFDLVFGGTTYTFKLGTSALIELQESCSTPTKLASIPEILDEVSKGRVKYVRAFLWAGLKKYHPGLSLEDVSDILDGADESEVRMLLERLGMSTTPDPKDLKEMNEGVKKNPPKAQTRRTRGTGASSTSRPAVSV